MRKLVFILVLSFLTLFTTHVNADSNKSDLIIGSWEDESGTAEFFRDGTFISTDTGKKYTGTWTIKQNTLRLLYITPQRVLHTYTIIEITDSTYKIKRNHADKRIYNAKRITLTQQSPVYTTKNSRAYHKRNCPELNTNDLIKFSSPQEAERFWRYSMQTLQPIGF